VKLWLANKVISAFYALLKWAWEVKMQAEGEEPVFFFSPVEHNTQDHSRMN
jgi:hypothetical protein